MPELPTSISQRCIFFDFSCPVSTTSLSSFLSSSILHELGLFGLLGKRSKRFFPASSSIDFPDIPVYASLAFSTVKSGAFARIRIAGSGMALNIDKYLFLMITPL